MCLQRHPAEGIAQLLCIAEALLRFFRGELRGYLNCHG
jgi:hypothetical protein